MKTCSLLTAPSFSSKQLFVLYVGLDTNTDLLFIPIFICSLVGLITKILCVLAQVKQGEVVRIIK